MRHASLDSRFPTAKSGNTGLELSEDLANFNRIMVKVKDNWDKMATVVICTDEAEADWSALLVRGLRESSSTFKLSLSLDALASRS